MGVILDELSEYSDLFYRSPSLQGGINTSGSSSNIDINSRSSIDNNRTIKQINIKPIINGIYKHLRIKKLMKRNIKRIFKL
jgi:hypothetical protein